MKKIPLNYYLNLYITEEIHNYYHTVNKHATMSGCLSWFEYIKTYLRGNNDLPTAVNGLMWELIINLGLDYGFNEDQSMETVVKYFINADYEQYLNYVIYMNDLGDKKIKIKK